MLRRTPTVMGGGDLLSRPRAAGSETGNENGRVVGAGTALPGGRAVVGALLVAIALVGTFAAYSGATADHRQTYVVASRDLKEGNRLTASDLELASMDLPAAGVARRAFTNSRALLGAVLTAPLARGELIQASHVVAKLSGSGLLEVSVPVDLARSVGGRLVPGDEVDVVATFGTGTDSYTALVVSGARVLAHDRAKGGLSAGGGDVLTLAVRDRTEALALTHAFTAGQLNLIRTTGGGPAGTVQPYRAPAQRKDS